MHPSSLTRMHNVICFGFNVTRIPRAGKKPLHGSTVPQGRWEQRKGFEEFYGGKSSAEPGQGLLSQATGVRHQPLELLLPEKHLKSASCGISICCERSQRGFLLQTKSSITKPCMGQWHHLT